MQSEKEAFKSSMNSLMAFVEKNIKERATFSEMELEKKIREIETFNANLDAKFLTLQNSQAASEDKENHFGEVIDFYRKFGETKTKLKLTLDELKDRNDLIKFLKIDIPIDRLKKIQSELLQADTLSTKEKVIIWCGALERAEKENSKDLPIKEILYKEIMLVKKRFMKPEERLISYEQQAALFLSKESETSQTRNINTLRKAYF